MKKIILSAFTAMLAFTFIPNVSNAATASIKTELPADSAAIKLSLESRLTEIGSIDKSTLSHKEKSTLRKETREIERTLNRDYGGVYISVGALILIIILLIILF
ncbi:hypothetical protein BH11BAC7_BH11BAC7_11100 [soil metagenome]